MMMTNPRRPYFNNLAAEWDHLPGMADAEERIRRFVQRSHAVGALRILDVGCGTGVLLPGLLEYYSDATCLVEFDLAESMLKVNAAKYPGCDIVYVCADAQSMPFLDSCFDLILCFGVLPHLDDKSSVLRQMFRILRPGGVLCVGHLMGSIALNAFHGSLSGPVSGDSLPSAAALERMLCKMGILEISAEEDPNWYFLRAVKP